LLTTENEEIYRSEGIGGPVSIDGLKPECENDHAHSLP